MTLRGGTWSCMVCGDLRADEQISVCSKSYEILHGRTQLRVNVRYCNDRLDCWLAAPGLADGLAAPGLDREAAP